MCVVNWTMQNLQHCDFVILVTMAMRETQHIQEQWGTYKGCGIDLAACPIIFVMEHFSEIIAFILPLNSYWVCTLYDYNYVILGIEDMS